MSEETKTVLICEATSHVCPIPFDEAVRMVDARFNPGGWTNADKTLAIMRGEDEDNPTKGVLYGIPVRHIPTSGMGLHTISVQGKMDLEKRRFASPCQACGTIGKGCAHRKPLKWKEAGHRCTPRCMFDDRLNKKTEESITGSFR